MSKIETGRYSERLRRALGMKGQEVVSGELSPEISPVFILEGNTIEWKFLQAVRACGSVTEQPGTVGNESIVRWVNPAESGVIAVFDHVDVSVNSLVRVNFGYGTSQAALPTAGVTNTFDHRWTAVASPTTVRVTRTSAGATIALASSIFVTLSLVDTPFSWDQPFILLPGEALEMGSAGSLNLAIRTNAAWTERRLPALEE